MSITSEKTVWTVLPNGVTTYEGNPYLKVTVAVSPRCYGGGTLGTDGFSDYLNWPTTLDTAAFSLIFYGAGGTSKTVPWAAGMPPVMPDGVHVTLDPSSPGYWKTHLEGETSNSVSTTFGSSLWGYLFDSNTVANPYTFQDYSGRFIITNPASDAYGLVKSQYQRLVATYPGQLPTTVDAPMAPIAIKNATWRKHVATLTFASGALAGLGEQAVIGMGIIVAGVNGNQRGGFDGTWFPDQKTENFVVTAMDATSISYRLEHKPASFNRGKSGNAVFMVYSKGLVTALAAANFPSAEFPKGFPDPMSFVGALRGISLESGKHYLTPPGSHVQALMYNSYYYLSQKEWEPVTEVVPLDPPDPNNPDATMLQWRGDIQAPSLDFHDQISAVAKFPELQRYLGLAIDLLVPVNAVGPAAFSTVQLATPVFSSSSNVDIAPRTNYSYSASDFSATTNPSLPASAAKIRQGMLDLTNSSFSLAEIDVDGAALNLVATVRQLFTSAPNADATLARTSKTSSTGLPSLTSAGLGILQTGSDQELASTLAAATLNNAQANAQAESGDSSTLGFYAEDLLRGYRVDIWSSATGKWQSLHERGAAINPAGDYAAYYPGSYEFTKNSQPGLFFTPSTTDEGFVSMSVTQDPNGPTSEVPSPDLYLHELVFRWLGWSLTAQRPNQYQDKAAGGEPGTSGIVTSYSPDPPAGVYLNTHFGAAAGSLPLLRFGTEYRLRVRAVDLAGNSPPLDSAVTAYQIPKSSLPAMKYRRFEPVVFPAIVLHDALQTYTPNWKTLIGTSPGESVHRLVIRTNYDKTQAEELSFLSRHGAPHLPPETTRWIVPPKITAMMAEHHGRFDVGGTLSDSALTTMLNYDSSFAVVQVPQSPQIVSTNKDANPSNTTTLALPYPESKLDANTMTGGAMPYLSDVLSAGASFTAPPQATTKVPAGFQLGLPGSGGQTVGPPGVFSGVDLSFTGTWPDIQPFRLTLVEGSGRPAWDGTNRILTVALPKARAATANISSFLRSQDLDLLGIVGWLEQAGGLTAAELTRLKALAVKGLMWAVTPYQDLTFVHAVQQPLDPIAGLTPKQSFVATRSTLGQTDVHLTVSATPRPSLAIDAPSTAKVDLNARWVEPRDDTTRDPSIQPDYADTSVELAAGSGVYPAGKPIPGLPKQLYSTQHVLDIPIAADPTTNEWPDDIGFGAGDDRIHKFGDTKHRNVYYDFVSTTRFLEYFPDKAQVPTTRTWPSLPISMVTPSQFHVTDPTESTWKVAPLSPYMTITLSGSSVAPDATVVVKSVATAGAGAWTVDVVPYLAYPAPETPPGPLTATGYTLASWGAKLNVPSSARPQSPNVLYAVPAFGWTTTPSNPEPATNAETITSHRTGGLLRVYLDRPFYSSGVEELLGVVLISDEHQRDVLTRSDRVKRSLATRGLASRDTNSGVITTLEKYVTQWGMDPLWASPAITSPPMTSDFPSAAQTQSGLYLEELGGKAGGVPVAVAGFPISYDADRGLYYCDIPFSAGNSYYPFVRMALASYQPNSIGHWTGLAKPSLPLWNAPDTVHLSRVIMTDFVQLAPNRAASVVTSPKQTEAKVTVSGIVPSNATLTGSLQILLEQQAPDIDPSSGAELSWVPVPGAEYSPTPTVVKNVATWAQKVQFPLPPSAGVPFRLLIREYEHYHSDQSTSQARLVYAATLEI